MELAWAGRSADQIAPSALAAPLIEDGTQFNYYTGIVCIGFTAGQARLWAGKGGSAAVSAAQEFRGPS